jgi:hypothetical protein
MNKSINDRIMDEYCDETFNLLNDSNLLNEYRECKSVKNEIIKLKEILENHNIENIIQESIIKDYLLELIPPGTKGVIRGNKFNKIIKDEILSLDLDNSQFEVCFEKKCDIYITSEIPDWYILKKITNKVIIGMNQLDLWGGGHQLNRGSKYIIDNKNNTENAKLVCVVCNKIQFNGNKSKSYKLFEYGYKYNTLCYIKNLRYIILNFLQ